MDVTTLVVLSDGRRKVINHHYRVLRKIGEGQYGKVLLAEVVKPLGDLTKGYVAIKTIHRVDKLKLLTKAYLLQLTKIQREIAIMKKLSHPNVVKLYQVIDDLRFDKILLVLEYCQLGELDWKRYNHYHEKYKQLLPQTEKLPRITLEKVLRDVVMGLHYLHDCKHIVHRDVKPLNLLVDANHTVKISDFGVLLILENNANDAKELARTMGTPAFFAPELCQFVHKRMSALTGQPAADLLALPQGSQGLGLVIDKRIDLWLLGVSLYTLIFHEVPFLGRNEFELFKHIVRQPLVFPSVVKLKRAQPQDVEELDALQDLITQLLQKDPLKRPTITQIAAHKFTTFDLTPAERKKWIALIPDYGEDDSLATRIRRLFKPVPTKETPISPLKPSDAATSTPKRPLGKLEAVDDLLDLYFDDLALDLSYGADAEAIDTLNTLAQLDDFRFDAPPQFDRIKKPSRVPTVAPLKLGGNGSRPHTPTRGSPQVSPIRDTATPPVKPPPVSIGARSPGAFLGLFSPARKMFAPRSRRGLALSTTSNRSVRSGLLLRLASSPQKLPTKPEPPAKDPVVEHTISLLSLPPTKQRGTKTVTDLAPPPAFALAAAMAGGGGSSDKRGRQLLLDLGRLLRLLRLLKLLRPLAALSPAALPFGGLLNRITLLLLSLNLNAYLTDDNSILALGREPSKDNDSDWEAEAFTDDDDDGEGDLTMILEAPPVPKHTVLMDEYLSRLP